MPGRWEYRTLWVRETAQQPRHAAGLERLMNQAGAEGWELVELTPDWAVFRRALS